MTHLKRLFLIPLSLAACAALSACQTTQSAEGANAKSEKVGAAIERAANKAGGRSSRYKNKSLNTLEKLYKRDSENPEIALSYAEALRQNDYLNRAEIVLKPFADDANSPAAVKTEFSALALAQGNYERAEKYAADAVKQDETSAEAYHNLGLALDTQGQHKKAEKAFRKGLELWQGDPTTIMNNLALNLASQGYLDEASEILQKAKSISPGRTEIERNLRIVAALQQSNGIRTPKPKKKPQIDG